MQSRFTLSSFLPRRIKEHNLIPTPKVQQSPQRSLGVGWLRKQQLQELCGSPVTYIRIPNKEECGLFWRPFSQDGRFVKFTVVNFRRRLHERLSLPLILG